MLFRRATTLVDAVHIDGSEAAFRAVFALPRAGARLRDGEIEVATACGRRVARRGSWVTRDTATQAVRLYSDDLFQAAHEPVM